MGGKTWSFDEERFFWHEVIPQSPKGVNPVDRTMDWDACARRMQSEMGEKARRRYTKLMLFEHYFQNVSTGHMSPHALAFVNEHKKQLAAGPEAPKEEKPSEPDDATAGAEPVPSADSSGIFKAGNFRPTTGWVASNVPIHRDTHQVPRLEIPPSVSSFSSLGSGFAGASTTEPANFFGYPPSPWVLESPHPLQASTSSLPYFGHGSVPTARTTGAESSPFFSSFRVMPSPMQAPMQAPNTRWEGPWAMPINSSKRKFDDKTGQSLPLCSAKRVMYDRSVRHNSLDALATAASLDSPTSMRGHGPAFRPRHDSLSAPSAHGSLPSSTLTTPTSTSQETEDTCPVEPLEAFQWPLRDVSNLDSWDF